MHLQSISAEQNPALFRQCVNFYKQQGYKGQVKLHDQLWVYKDADTMIAAARIVKASGEKILRGVWVAANYRQQGVGKQFLTELKNTSALNDCYTFPYLELESFYASIGFDPVSEPPVHLDRLLSRYNRKTRQVLLMKIRSEQVLSHSSPLQE